MPDLLLELLSEEIPARMQAKARADLARLLTDQLAAAGLQAEAIETYATPRRLALIARGLPLGTPAVSEELKGPRTSAPPQALEGFLRKTGLSQDQLEDRNGTWFALIEKPGRATTDGLAQAVPAIVRAFPWPKSMRWGAASLSTESPRWVRPLQGVVAMLDEELIDFEIGDVRSSAATLGHRFHHPGRITLAGASDYLEKLRACHVIVDQDERASLIREGAAALAAQAGLTLVEDEGLVQENAGLTEWPVPLLGRFDEAFLEVPREVIQLTMRTNQKYFALQDPPLQGEGDHAQHGGGVSSSPPGALSKRGHPSVSADALPPPPAGEDRLANAFICVANIAATDGAARIVAGNQKVLAARLADARFFWEQDLKIPLEDQAQKLGQIVFHEKLGTLADKVDRVAKLARWLVEEGIVTPQRNSSVIPAQAGTHKDVGTLSMGPGLRRDDEEVQHLAALAERAARLCKADLVTQMVGEFPELQGLIGGYLAAAQGEDPEVAAAIRDHYKPVGQGDEVPTAPVTVAVSLADKLDSLFQFFLINERPTGSKDPYALRRAALGVAGLLVENSLRVRLSWLFEYLTEMEDRYFQDGSWAARWGVDRSKLEGEHPWAAEEGSEFAEGFYFGTTAKAAEDGVVGFLADRLKVQQREAGVRHDLIDAVFALGGEDDLVRLLARVRALQSFVETPEGADLLAGYKRAANILKKEDWPLQTTDRHPGLDPGSASSSDANEEGRRMPDRVRYDEEGPSNPISLSYTPEPAETDLISALDSAEPQALAAIAREDFEAAMAALATLRAPVDTFFDKVIVNDPDANKRAARLSLLARIRSIMHQVADFSRIEG